MDGLVLWPDVSGGSPAPDLLTIKWGSFPPWLACWVGGPGVDVHSVSTSQEQWWEGNQGRTYWGHPWFPKVYRCGWETSGQEVSLPESSEWGHSATPSGKRKFLSSILASIWNLQVCRAVNCFIHICPAKGFHNEVDYIFRETRCLTLPAEITHLTLKEVTVPRGRDVSWGMAWLFSRKACCPFA